MTKRKICIVTGSRAEYGLLYWLIKEVDLDQKLDLQLIVTGMHLSSEFGMTFKEIEKDFTIHKKIKMDLSSDCSQNISKSIGLTQIAFSNAFNKLKPDIIVLLGDRYEILSAACASLISKIPIAHIHGGEVTIGSWDDSIRHCISKMSHLHFVATEQYKKRVVQMGENPKKVYNVGGLGTEFINKIKLLSKKDLETSINFKFNKKNIIVTYHPVTLEDNSEKKQFQQILEAIHELEDTNIIFTKANSDLNGRVVNQMIDDYCSKNSTKSKSFISLGQLRYLSVLKYVDAVVGNSSSGLLEAPSFKIATINIGDRQKGRIKAKSVIDCLPYKEQIKKSFKKIYSKEFQKNLKHVKNPYQSTQPSKIITKVLKNIELKNILKKGFYDISF